MLINADDNIVNFFDDAIITYNSNIHNTSLVTSVDASISPDKIRYYDSF